MDDFIEYVINLLGFTNEFRCLCMRYRNDYFRGARDVKYHLLKHGIMVDYDNWYHHREPIESISRQSHYVQSNVADTGERNGDANAYEMLYNMHRGEMAKGDPNINDRVEIDLNEEPNTEAQKFYKLLKNAEQKLYLTCDTYTKLLFVVNLFQVKCLYNLPNAALDKILMIFQKALP